MLKNSKVTLARSSMATKPNPLEGKEVDEERVGMDGKGKRLGPPNPAALYFFGISHGRDRSTPCVSIMEVTSLGRCAENCPSNWTISVSENESIARTLR